MVEPTKKGTKLKRMSSIHDQGTNSHGIIAAGPIVALLDSLRADLACFRRRSPECVQVGVLATACDDLAKAIDEARKADLYLTVDDLAQRIDRPRSTIARICRQHGQEAGATKVQGAWMIHFPKFMACISRPIPSTQQEAA
jgi:hypothetical protein